MPLRILKPVTPGQRLRSVLDFSQLTGKKPNKRLTVFLKKAAGRNNQGKISVRHQGGGHKQKYRLIDFKRIDKLNIEGIVKTIEYDPNRNCFIALIIYKDGEKRYHIAPKALKIGDKIITASRAKIRVGNRLKLEHIPPGIEICELELKPGKGSQLVRSAGTLATIISLEGPGAQVQLPSGEIRLIPKECYATIGSIGNEDYANLKIGKAGRTRWMGIRPTVRGKAMNPIDHPHGGGEGNQPIGLPHPKTPWGAPALGKLTRRVKKYSDTLILKRRKKKKRK